MGKEKRIVNWERIVDDNRVDFMFEIKTPDGLVTVGTRADSKKEAKKIVDLCLKDTEVMELIRNLARRAA